MNLGHLPNPKENDLVLLRQVLQRIKALEKVVTILTHHARHENGGADEISVAGLSGLLADAQTPLGHHANHEDGGSDEMSAEGLAGQLAESQTGKYPNSGLRLTWAFFLGAA